MSSYLRNFIGARQTEDDDRQTAASAGWRDAEQVYGATLTVAKGCG